MTSGSKEQYSGKFPGISFRLIYPEVGDEVAGNPETLQVKKPHKSVSPLAKGWRRGSLTGPLVKKIAHLLHNIKHLKQQ